MVALIEQNSPYLREYDDGAGWPNMTAAKERAFRQGFLEEARRAVREWTSGDLDLFDPFGQEEAARQLRLRTRERYTVYRSEYGPGCAGRKTHHVGYRPGHDVPAARLRGRHHALAYITQASEDVQDEDFGTFNRHVLPAWLAAVERWAAKPMKKNALSAPPPRPLSIMRADGDGDAGKKLVSNGNTSSTPSVPSSPPCGTAPLTAAMSPTATVPAMLSVRELVCRYTDLRRPVIHGLLREGEVMNIIAPPKTGKSWLATDLALAVATGRPWLGTFETIKGDVLIIDNELHPETSAHRIPRVAKARGLPLDTYAARVWVQNLRGQLRDLIAMKPYFAAIEPGQYKLIILDAFYRFMPKETSENDNATMAMLYNHLDRHAARLGCSFVLIHHASKGNQSGKAVTDVGAGAGSQSRATDTHLVLRAHEEDNIVVLDAAVRSWPPLKARCLRWDFPVFNPVSGLDATALRPDRPRRPKKDKGGDGDAKPAPKPEMDVDTFVTMCVSAEGKSKDAVLFEALSHGTTKTRARTLLRLAEENGQIHRWTYGANQPIKFATVPQPIATDKDA